MFCSKCGKQNSAKDQLFCGGCGAKLESPSDPSATSESEIGTEKQATTVVSASGIDALNLAIQNLGFLKSKISKHTAYLGVLIGFAVFGFSLFLAWASIPTGNMATDGGTRTGWSELAFLALLPLGFSLYPVFMNRSIELKTLLINIAIAFALLGYNNVINRATWQNGFGNMGSDLGAGFWLGLLSMLIVSGCGIAWALHTAAPDDLKSETSL